MGVRLEDIDSAGKWRRSHTFQIGDQTVSRVQGESARGLMREWVTLRESFHEQKYKFNEVRVWGQPSAWADSIISCWVSDAVAEMVHQAVTVLDCFHGQWSPVVLETAWWNMQFQIPVAPDSTPLLQIADVLVIASAKSAGTKKKRELELLLSEKARREGVAFAGKFGKYEAFS